MLNILDPHAKRQNRLSKYVLFTSKRASLLAPLQTNSRTSTQVCKTSTCVQTCERVLKRIRKSARKSDLRPINVCRLALGGQTMKILSRLECEFELDPPAKVEKYKLKEIEILEFPLLINCSCPLLANRKF